MYISPKMNFYFYEIVNHHTKTKQQQNNKNNNNGRDTYTYRIPRNPLNIFKSIEKKRIDRIMKSTLHIYLISCYYF